MAIRNYVGARYVPKFADPVEWQVNTSYEAMVIVTYNNSSYTSKIPVPPTVSNPAENSEYWALTGNYNAQVEEYRQETNEVKNELNTTKSDLNNVNTKLTNDINNVNTSLTKDINNTNENLNKTLTSIRKPLILCVGDSYGRGYYSGREHVDESWPAYLGNSPYCDTVNYCISGACAERGATNAYYTQEIINAKNAGVEPDIIVLSGGTNEYKCSNLSNALTSFIDSCHTTFPNARLYIDWNSVAYRVADSNKRDFYNQYFSQYLTYRNVCSNKGIPFSTSCINARFTSNSVADDMIHLSPTGYASVANDIKNVIFGGGIQYNYGNCERLTTVDNINLFFTQCGDSVKVSCNIDRSNDISSAFKSSGLLHNDSVSDSAPSSSYGVVPNIIEGFTGEQLNPDSPYYPICNIRFTTKVAIGTGGTFTNNYALASIWVHDGKIRLSVSSVTGNNFTSVPSGSTVILLDSGGEIMVPAIYFC